MKKLMFFFLLVGAITSLFSCTPKYKGTDQALSYIWYKVQDGSEFPQGSLKVQVADSTFYYYATMNYIPDFNRSRLMIRLKVNDKQVSEFWAESSSGYWQITRGEDKGNNEFTNTFAFGPEEENLAKLAYRAFKKR